MLFWRKKSTTVDEAPDKPLIERIVERINSKNCKGLATALTICFAFYHGWLHYRYGTNSCQWLLSNGRYKGDQEWQPYGCMLHLYSKIDTRRCLRYIAFYGSDTRFVFIGDTRIKEMYHDFVNHILINEGSSTETPRETESNAEYIDNKIKVKVEFIWSPFISKKMVQYFRNWQLERKPPSVIIVGSAISAIRASNASLEMIQNYDINITRLVEPFSRLKEKQTKILWAIQEPVLEKKLKIKDQMITNVQIDLYNKAAIEVLSHSAADLWWSVRLIGQGMISESPDGIHLAAKPLHHNTQILLNMYCNDYMNFNDGTCCRSTEHYSTIQIVTFAVLGACTVIASCMILQTYLSRWRGKPEQENIHLFEMENQTLPSKTKGYYVFFVSLAKLGVIMIYFFICDRTNFFMKENKYYSEFSFWLPIGYIAALGLFFTEDSKLTKVLHRDQLNEWKGWMLLVILVYHITGAQGVLQINMHMKVLMSSYLFLLGYEQFSYVWLRNDVSIVSFFKMMFQLNFMTIILCLCMNRSYQFYYFVPLLSFWYLMVYCFLSFPPYITAQSLENNMIEYFYLLIKFICFFSVLTILFMSEVFFEKVFVTRPWKALFVSADDDIHEWWYRWKLDRYSVMYGMTFAVVMLLSQRHSLYDDNNHGNLFSRGISLTATLLGIIGIGCYITMTFLCRDELECSEIHSYVVFIPIISYIILRNISGILRTRYSSLFAWFGEISLELFICQYHIWLAADTHGVLVLLPGYPVLNVIITSFIFICSSHEVHRLTKILLPYLVPKELRYVLRNLLVFVVILVPIGINDGMF